MIVSLAENRPVPMAHAKQLFAQIARLARGALAGATPAESVDTR
ncbi:hypothetical protein [Paraburkholderia metrosideri]|jgi:hypothetical protein|nr:hypothetical protein [Paraburkholderia metrosideri]